MSEVENVISSFEPEAPVEAVTLSEAPKEVKDSESEVESKPKDLKDESEGDEKDKDFEEWDSKRARNRISRQDKRIAKLTWEKHQYEQKLAELQAQTSQFKLPEQTQQISQDDRPKEEDYVGRYDEFVKASSVWESKQATKMFLEEQQKQQAIAIAQQQQNAHLQQLADQADKATDKFIAEVPDAAAAKKEFEEVAEDLPPQTIVALMSLGENAPKAIYQLWKADKFDELASANPMQAQILIASALATPFTKPVSKAPAPVRSAKGSTSTAVNPDNYSPDELLKLIRKG